MKKFFCFILLLGLLLSLGACAPEPSGAERESTQGSETSGAVGDLPMNGTSGGFRDPVMNGYLTYSEIYGDSIYMATDDFGILRCDPKTGERTSACVDPTCEGGCLVETDSLSILLGFSGIYDDVLYFTVYDAVGSGSDMVYGSLDLVTGEAREIYRHPYGEALERKCLVADGYLYFRQNVTVMSGDTESEDIEEPRYFRIPLVGGDAEEVWPDAEDAKNREICFAVGDILYVYAYGAQQFISYNVKTEEERVLYVADGNCYLHYYYDGKIYFSKTDAASAEITQYGMILAHLCVLDTNTGEVKRLVEDYVWEFTVTADGVYYRPYEFRTLHTPKGGQDPVTVYYSADLHRCDLDGSNDTVVYRSESVGFSLGSMGSGEIVGGVFYGDVSEFYVGARGHGYKHYGLSKVDFKTGEITPWVS